MRDVHEDEELVLIQSWIERDGEIGVITGKSTERKNGSHFVFPLLYFYPPPSEAGNAK